MNNIRKIIEERLENARNDYSACFEKLDTPMFISDMLAGQIEAYQDCLNLIDEYTPKIVTKQLSVKEIETLLQDLNKPHQFIIDKPAPRTEQEILNDFEKLGYKVAFVSQENRLLLYKTNGDTIFIYKNTKEYEKCDIIQSINFTMQEHKLLNELFICWEWL